VFASAEKFEEWFSRGDGGKEKEAEVVQQLHKVNTVSTLPAAQPCPGLLALACLPQALCPA
jgi:hypothetical protein